MGHNDDVLALQNHRSRRLGRYLSFDHRDGHQGAAPARGGGRFRPASQPPSRPPSQPPLLCTCMFASPPLLSRSRMGRGRGFPRGDRGVPPPLPPSWPPPLLSHPPPPSSPAPSLLGRGRPLTLGGGVSCWVGGFFVGGRRRGSVW